MYILCQRQSSMRRVTISDGTFGVTEARAYDFKIFLERLAA